jgi:hypothetical protein
LEGGVSGFADVAEAVAVAVSRPGGRGFSARMREIERRFGFSTSARATAAGGHRLLAKIESGQALLGPETLAEERCWETLERCFFGRLQRYVGPRLPFPDLASVDHLRSACKQALAPRVRQLARRLVADLSAARLRAPAASTPKTPMTRELLDEPLMSEEK